MNDLKKPSLKLNRQSAIRDVLNSYQGSTQEEIKDYLKKRGIKASQSSLSRDLREIGAVKIPVNNGKSCYKLSGTVEEFGQTILNYSINYEAIGNILVIKTTPGNAPGFCVILDHQGWSEIAGTIAGDDTILVIARNSVDIKSLIAKLDNVM